MLSPIMFYEPLARCYTPFSGRATRIPLKNHMFFFNSVVANGDLLHRAEIRVALPEDGVEHIETRRRNVCAFSLYI